METESLNRASAGRRLWPLWLACFAAFALLYVATAQRGASWQDSGGRQWRILTGDYDEPLGLALVHPLYTAIGQLVAAVPLGSVTARINAFSGLAMAVALANLAAVVALLTGRRWIGAATAGMLAVCHTVWWLSTIAETYTLNAALFTVEIWLLMVLLDRPRWQVLVALAAAAGLNWSVHNLALLAMPVYVVAAVALVVRGRLPAWSLAAAAGAFVVGAGGYLVMIVSEVVSTGDLAAAVNSALFGRYRQAVLNVGAWPGMKVNAVLMAMNFVSFLPILAVIGWAKLAGRLGRKRAAAIAVITAVEVVFVARYSVQDEFMFLLPTLVMVAIAAGVGLAAVADASPRWRKAGIVACLLSIAAPPVFYAAAPALARMAGARARRARQLPYRDELRYWLVPWKHNEHSAERFACAALAQVGDDAVVLLDRTALNPVLVARRVHGLAGGSLVAGFEGPLPYYDDDPEGFRAALGGRPLYVLSPQEGYIPGNLLADATFVQEADGPLFRAIWRRPVEPTSSATAATTRPQ